MFVLTDSQQVSVAVVPQDKKGFPVALPSGESISWQSSDAGVMTVAPAADGLSAVVAAVAPGSAQLHIIADDGDGNPEAVGTSDFQVVAGSLAQLGVSIGEPSEQ